MKAENAIEVNNITKKFKVYLDKGKTLKELLLFSKRRKYEERKVLNGISFTVKRGEAIGLIGKNGCGKSTTLKLLTRIMYPDSGSIEMRGRVSSLIELGAGFHPDISGRQNIYTNASIFGLTRKEIDEKISSIIEFSELEEYIDNPVRTYSSGMYMRLAFSVAINVNADILLIDEILAVGDSNFQTKCFNKLREIKSRGTTIVIVSHSLSQIEQICERSIWIKDGAIMRDGEPRMVHLEYLSYMGESQEKRDKIESDIQSNKETKKVINTRWGNGDARIEKIECFGDDGKNKLSFKSGENIKIKIYYKVYKPIQEAVLGIAVFRNDGVQCYGTNTSIDRLDKVNLNNDGEYIITLNKNKLLTGDYSLDLAIEAVGGVPIDYYTKALNIKIHSDIQDVGIMRIDHNWII